MKDLYIKIKELINDNYKGTLTDTTLDIITVSIMALYIQSPEIIINKMPTILNKIDIIAGDDKVSNYILKKRLQLLKLPESQYSGFFVVFSF